MKVLSLFDGMGGARIALDNLGIDCEYYASEIDEPARLVHMKNYPDTIQVGDVTKLTADSLPEIDLLIGGSPCQSFSTAARQKESGLVKGESQLFFEYLRVLKEVKPKYFILENVASMKNTDRDKISDMLGVKPITINSHLLTAQMRRRHYWTNIPGLKQPDDKGILLHSVLEPGSYTIDRKSYCLTATYNRACPQDYFCFGQRQMVFNMEPTLLLKTKNMKTIAIDEDAFTISTKRKDVTGQKYLKPYMKKLSPVECERLQGVPDGYTDHVSTKERYKMIGNGFTVPVIEHLLKGIKDA
jgi:site-specific DNA-cytosine methylase